MRQVDDNTKNEGDATMAYTSSIRVAVVGLGYWGLKLLRTLSGTSNCQVEVGCDIEPAALKRARELYPSLYLTEAWSDVLAASIDAVVIATPASTHFRLAHQALISRKHVFVEKPLSTTTRECDELIREAQESGRKLMVGHTYLYSPAVIWLRRYIQDGLFGDLFYLYSQRLNLGRVRHDVSALWNLAPHDISIVLYLLDALPTQVSARGASFLQKDRVDVAFLTLQFPSGVVAHSHVSWFDPLRVRRFVIVGQKGMAIYDDTKLVTPISIYTWTSDREQDEDGLTSASSSILARDFDLHFAKEVFYPEVATDEPLQTECDEFIECILADRESKTDGVNGLRVVRVLELADRSLRSDGVPLVIDW